MCKLCFILTFKNNYDTICMHFLELFKQIYNVLVYNIHKVCLLKFPCLLTDYMKACLCIQLPNSMAINKTLIVADIVVSKLPP